MGREPFEPSRPEKTLKAIITAREAHLLSELRQVAYGEFVVYKANNMIVRVQTGKSILVSEDEGLKALKEG